MRRETEAELEQREKRMETMRGEAKELEATRQEQARKYERLDNELAIV